MGTDWEAAVGAAVAKLTPEERRRMRQFLAPLQLALRDVTASYDRAEAWVSHDVSPSTRATSVNGSAEPVAGSAYIAVATGIRAVSPAVADLIEKAEKSAPGLKATLIGVLVSAVIQCEPKPPEMTVPALHVNTTSHVVLVTPGDLSLYAGQVRTVLGDGAPRTADELAAATNLPAAVVDAALAELRAAGRVEEIAAGLFGAR